MWVKYVAKDNKQIVVYICDVFGCMDADSVRISNDAPEGAEWSECYDTEVGIDYRAEYVGAALEAYLAESRRFDMMFFADVCYITGDEYFQQATSDRNDYTRKVAKAAQELIRRHPRYRSEVVIEPANASEMLPDCAVVPSAAPCLLVHASSQESTPPTNASHASPLKNKKDSAMKTNLKNSIAAGAKTAAADEAGNLLLDLVDKVSNGSIGVDRMSPEGRSLAKMVAATLLLHSTETLFDDTATREGVEAACGLVISAASRDIIQPRMRELRAIGLNLANIGNKSLEATARPATSNG